MIEEIKERIWLIDFKQTLAPFSELNFDGSEWSIGTAVIVADSVQEALESLGKHLVSKGEKLLDVWHCQLYQPKKLTVREINQKIDGYQTNSHEYDRVLKMHLGYALGANNNVAVINGLSSTTLEDMEVK